MNNVPLLEFQDVDPDVVKSITINTIFGGNIYRIKKMFIILIHIIN